MPEMAQIFTEESCIPNGRTVFNVELLGPYGDHVWVILGPFLGYFYNILAFRFLKWLKFSLKSHACQAEDYSLISNYPDHIGSMFGPSWGHVLAISTISLRLDA